MKSNLTFSHCLLNKPFPVSKTTKKKVNDLRDFLAQAFDSAELPVASEFYFYLRKTEPLEPPSVIYEKQRNQMKTLANIRDIRGTTLPVDSNGLTSSTQHLDNIGSLTEKPVG